MLLCTLVLLPCVTNASPLGELITSRLKALQAMKLNDSEDIHQISAQKGFSPEFGHALTMRDLFAKETLRLMAHVGHDRMPSRRHDDSYEMYYPRKKKKSHVLLRQFFESEEFILFLIGVGLASFLGMATIMAPLKQAMYSNAYGGVPAGIQAMPVGPVIFGGPQGQRKRRSLPQSRKVEQAHATYRSASERFAKLNKLATSRAE